MSAPIQGGVPDALPPRRTWDLILTIVLLVLLVPFDFLVSFAGAFMGMASDGCTRATCDYGQMDLGVLTSLLGPTVILLIGVIVCVHRLVRRRLGFVVAILTGVGMIAVWAVGAAVVAGAIRN